MRSLFAAMRGRKAADSYDSLPGPKVLPVLGVGPQIIREGVEAYLQLHREYGRIVRAPLPNNRSVFVSDKDMVKMILAQTERKFRKGDHYKILHRFSGLGLLNNGGPGWRSRRKTLNPLLAPGAFPILGELSTKVCAEFAADIERAGTDPAGVDVTGSMMKMMFSMLAGLLFSSPEHMNFATLGQAFADIQHYLSIAFYSPVVPPLWAPFPGGSAARRAHRLMTDFIKELIKERRERPSPGDDLLGRLMQARDAESGAPISEYDIINEVITFFFAGHDTTALTASYTLGFLAEHPSYIDRILAETDGMSDADLAGLADVRRESTARNVIFESMRMRPPVYAVTRNNLETFTYKDLTFDPNTTFLISIIGLHHDPEYWQDAETFLPERFNGLDFMTESRFIPFGGGPRMCMGPYLSMLELTGVIVRILRTHRPTAVVNKPKLTASLTTIPSPYLRLTFEKRQTGPGERSVDQAI